jgi:hypothetical protein
MARLGDVLGGGRNHAAVTPHASNVLSPVPRALWIGTGGDLRCSLTGNAATLVTYTNIPDGTLLNLRAAVVHTDTTASEIVAIS